MKEKMEGMKGKNWKGIIEEKVEGRNEKLKKKDETSKDWKRKNW